MQDDLIRKIATLMAEQSAAYAGLGSLTGHLISSLTSTDPNKIESLSRAGESELFRMRSRLLEITSLLTQFADLKSGQTEPTPIDTNTREEFEKAANALLEIARQFEKIVGRATSLALSGSSFAAANIQMCGVPPTTYNAPVMRYGKGVAA
jgi:hypothetical protein